MLSMVSLNWFSQNLITNVVWLVIVLIGGASLALIKKYLPSLAPYAMYFLVGCACVAIVVGLVMIWPEPTTNTNTIERDARRWLDNFGLSNKTIIDDSVYFALQAQMANGTLIIARSKKRDRYLEMTAGMNLSPEHEVIVKSLTPERIKLISDSVIRQLALGRVNMVVTFPFKEIRFVRMIPIIKTLNESTFIEAVDDVDKAMLIARQTIVIELQTAAMTPAH